MAVKESKTRITISVDKEFYKEIKEQAEKEMRSVSSLVNYVVAKYLEEQKNEQKNKG
jgi:metal-responsive CopG/Arc/MetJ family transcriptional regulator